MTATRRVGDLVSVDHPKYPGLWKIRKICPANTQLDRCTEAGSTIPGRGLKCPHYLIIDPIDQQTAATEQLRPPFHPGQIVRYDGNPKATAELYVVLADKLDTVNITALGGEGGRYWRASPRHLVPVDLLEALGRISA